jgi:hypothetical protein
MGLPDLYAVKFKVLQHLENNRLNYQLARVKQSKSAFEDEGKLGLIRRRDRWDPDSD